MIRSSSPAREFCSLNSNRTNLGSYLSLIDWLKARMDLQKEHAEFCLKLAAFTHEEDHVSNIDNEGFESDAKELISLCEQFIAALPDLCKEDGAPSDYVISAHDLNL